MAEVHPPLAVFNRGRLSRIGLARVDLDRTQLSADIQTNWMPRTLGSMMLRPGLEYIGTINNSSTAILIPFIRATKDTALLELTSTTVRVWINDTLVERDPTTSTFTLGNFSSTLLGGWTDADEAGTTSAWFGSTTIASASSDFMSLVGTRFARAIRRQTVASSSGNHAVRVAINRGRVNVRIGSSAGGDNYFNERLLRPGVYSLKIASTGDFNVEFSANTLYRSLVEQISVESSGPMKIDSTWVSSDLSLLRWDQSGDIVYVASGSTGRQKRIERYATESWAIADYEPDDGPFLPINISQTRLAPSALTGDITLEADHALFRSNHVGALFKITSAGQDVSVTVSASDQFSNPIRVAGVGGSRLFDILITAASTFDATTVVQRSVGSTDSFADVSGLSYTSTASGVVTSTNHQDNLDNQIVYYRIGSEAYVSGTPIPSLQYDAGGLSGVVRINAVTNTTESSAAVLTDLGSTSASDLWEEGAWSDVRGYPSAVVFHENRLWWAGKSKVWGSVSDGFEGFDPEVEGDDGPINKTITSGPTDKIEWLQSLGTLIIGSQGREQHAKTNSLEVPLTPSLFNLRDISTQGSAPIQAIKIDTRTVFVQRSGIRVYEVGYSIDALTYQNRDLSALVPEIGEPEFARMAVQRQPDTRVHCVRGSTDGTVGLLMSDKAENVLAWIDVETGTFDGVRRDFIEDVAVLPSSGEDAVYYLVRREINGSTELYLERWAQEIDATLSPIKAWTSVCFDVSNATTDDFISSITVGGDEVLGQSGYPNSPWCNGESLSQKVADSIFRNAWDLTTWTRDLDKFLPITDITPFRVEVSGDGCRMYLANSFLNDTIRTYKMSTAWDIRTATLLPEEEFDFTGESTQGVMSYFFKPDGFKLYVLSNQNASPFAADLFQYTLATPWDLSTATYDDVSFDLENLPPSVTPLGNDRQFPDDIEFRPDGTALFVFSRGQEKIFQYALSPPWDISTMVYDNKLAVIDPVAENFYPGEQGPNSMFFSAAGDTAFLLADGNTTTLIHEYDIPTAWDVSSMSTGDASTNHDLADLGLLAMTNDFTFRPNGTSFFQTKVPDDEFGGDDNLIEGIYQIDLAGGTFRPGDYTAGPSTAPSIIRSSPLTSGNPGGCVFIEGPLGLCSSERVVVTATPGIVVTQGSDFLGHDTICNSSHQNCIADSFKTQNSTATNIITGADHLVGEKVVVWGDGQDLGTYTVSSTGTFTVPVASSAFCYGLTYEAWYKSVKLAYGSELGTALTQRKRVDHLGVVLFATHAKGLRYGHTTSTADLQSLPEIEDGGPVSPNALHGAYDQEAIEFPGEWDSDSRIILHAKAPRPCTVLGAIIEMETKE